MPGLGETTAMLARLRRSAKAPASDVAAGRMVETAAFGANPGRLRMYSYAPEGLAGGAPLVVVLHGCTQGAEAYAADAGWLTLAQRHGFVVVAAEQTAANNPNRCFNWFSPGDTRRGEGEAASIAAMTAHAIGEHGADPERVFVTGLSAGGAMTCVMLAAYPDVFAGGAIIAGLPYGVAGNVQDALRVMNRADGRSAPELGGLVRGAAPIGGRIPRVAIWHGGADTVVSASNADDIASQWAWTHGLAVEPDEVRSQPGRTRSTWRSPSTGEVLIEAHRLAGLGHGTPLASTGAEGVGAVAPYMLEAGVSSSSEILAFWGVKPRPASAWLTAPSAPAPAPASEAWHELKAPHGLGAQVMASLAPHVPGSVQDVIAKALKSAGLMR
ncbi:PHB depolymerase family esterase [Phenylobacterium sp.]|uniref:extracellular catalytic domain type 1 short-chain-length polyhydroxyalkanoate depolymerase n=1 Tax=Phenylobacterium sp. TaxID=1871053 RepID=UPI00286A4DBA|nr:PHB depolymerase family esterase [Phenylobacterium sp.]